MDLSRGVAIVVMPWATASRPSLQAAKLKATLQSSNPQSAVCVRNECLELAYRIGPEMYETLFNHAEALGCPLYQSLLDPDAQPASKEQWVARVQYLLPDVEGDAAHFASLHTELLELLSEHLFDLVQVLQKYSVAIFIGSEGAEADLAVAERVRALGRETRIVLQAEVKAFVSSVLECGAQAPTHDFDEFAQLAAHHHHAWTLPVRTTDDGGAARPATLVAQEIATMSDKYKVLDVTFEDRASSTETLTRSIKDAGRDLRVRCALWSDVSNAELVGLWRAGLSAASFEVLALLPAVRAALGVEGSVMSTLSIMKTCFELGIQLEASILVNVPGFSSADVDRTYNNIMNYACGFEPCVARPYFSVSRELPSLTTDADWTPVIEICDRWSRIREFGSFERTQTYREAPSFVLVTDERYGDLREAVYEGASKELFMFCIAPRPFSEIEARLPSMAPAALRSLLDEMIEDRVMYAEEDTYMTLSVSARPSLAAERILQSSR